ncbi:glycosyltransferase family 2 protein [Patescibacteria group bacterium]|nr:glycosyltransferase family 2 protein [Patescibacteria group bacterium]
MNNSLSVVVPFFNEENNLPILHKELIGVLRKLGMETEIVYVNDGSTDSSASVLENAVKKTKDGDIRIKIVSFRKNFGQTAAISAGIDKSSGNLVSFLDADLQNDPGALPKFLEKINEGYDAAFGWRKQRKDKTVRRIFSVSANKLIQVLFNYPFHDVGCSARVVKKEFLEDLQLYGELHRILPVLVYLKGAKVAEVVVNHRPRLKGKSKYGYSRIIKTIIDLITVKFLSSYGTKPSYVFGSLGLGSLFFGGISLLAVAYRKIFLGIFVHTDPLFLIAVFLVLLGTQFILMGLLAELQVRTYFESQGKPIYEIKEIERF